MSGRPTSAHAAYAAQTPIVQSDRKLELVTEFEARGSQPEAIEELVAGVERGDENQILLGITGSGKTFTIANLIDRVQRPTLILAHNKTLAAQLYSEFKALFPNNAVEYFVSYYDYYQPEAYVPSTDTYIEKDSNINEQIDRMRHSATFSLLSRKDVIIVASVSCIYGIGAAESYLGMVANVKVGEELDRDAFLRRLVAMRYERNDADFSRGKFRVRGDVVELFPAYASEIALRIEFFGDEVEAIREIDALRGKTLGSLSAITVFPASHYVTPGDRMRNAIAGIKTELSDRLITLKEELKLVEAQRLEQRCMYDIEMLEEMGHCSGIENYSRHLTGLAPGEPPPTLIDYFPRDFLMVVDESHQTVPQVGAMYKGDRARKQNLVDHGFRLPSALDNRPLKFEEWVERRNQTVFVSATPGNYEFEQCEGVVVEQIIRPTGLLDPQIDIRPIGGQVDDLLDEIKATIKLNERVLVTTLTKRMAEDLTEYYADLGLRVRHIHADVDTLERVELIRDLRNGVFDVLVGINLLREGLDMPEVSLVAILDADKEGFLRNRTSLIQTCGRAARNVKGRVIMYADRVTDSMQAAIDETERRRKIQSAYNEAHGIVPKSVTAKISELHQEKPNERDDPRTNTGKGKGKKRGQQDSSTTAELDAASLSPEMLGRRIAELESEMREHAKALRYEDAAFVRDRLKVYRDRALEMGLVPE